MNKYIDADKLIAEIKRLQQQNDTGEDKDYPQYELDVASGYDIACDEILGLIYSLRQEQPEVDLEKELKIKKATLLDDAFGPMNGEQSLAIRNFARHFYEFGLNTRKEDQ